MRSSLLPALTLFALIAASGLALAASIEDRATGTRLTADKKGTGYSSRDNVVGRLTETKGGKIVGIADAKITVRDPHGKQVGEGTTDKDGNYDIDTTLDNVSGWTLTFDSHYISGDMTM